MSGTFVCGRLSACVVNCWFQLPQRNVTSYSSACTRLFRSTQLVRQDSYVLTGYGVKYGEADIDDANVSGTHTDNLTYCGPLSVAERATSPIILFLRVDRLQALPLHGWLYLGPRTLAGRIEPC